MASSNDSDSDNESTRSSSHSSESVDETNINLRSALPEAIKRGSVEDVKKLLKSMVVRFASDLSIILINTCPSLTPKLHR